VRVNLERSGSWIGMAGVVVVLFLYGASGLLAPAWAVVVLLLVWLVHFVLACCWFQTRPYRVLALPFVAAAVWFGAMFIGGSLLGWTA